MSGFQYFMLGVGGLAALCGVLIFVMRVRTIVSGRVTQGVIVGEKVETHAGTRNEMRSVSHAIFEFEHEGKIYRCQSSFGAPRGTEAGTAVRAVGSSVFRRDRLAHGHVVLPHRHDGVRGRLHRDRPLRQVRLRRRSRGGRLRARANVARSR